MKERNLAMPLISCPECGGKVSDRAVRCPHCGYAVSSAPNALNTQNTQNTQNAQNTQNTQNAQNTQNTQNAQNMQNAQNIQNAQNTPIAEQAPYSAPAPEPAAQTSGNPSFFSGLAKDKKKLLMIVGAVAAVLVIGYFALNGGTRAGTTTPGSTPAGQQNPISSPQGGQQGGQQGSTVGTVTPISNEYSLFTSGRFGFSCYIPVSDYVTEDENFNIYVCPDQQFYIPYTMISCYNYTDAPGVLDAVIQDIQKHYGNDSFTLGMQTQSGTVTDYNTNTTRIVYYTMCYYNLQGYTICDWRYAVNIGSHVYVVTTKDIDAQSGETNTAANLILQTIKEG